MLPRVDLIRGEQTSWLLLNSPDHISDVVRKHGRWADMRHQSAALVPPSVEVSTRRVNID